MTQESNLNTENMLFDLQPAPDSEPTFINPPAAQKNEGPIELAEPDALSRKFVAYTVKLPAEQLAALQSIWLELKRLYGSHSPDKSGMIQQAIEDWLRRWDGPERGKLLDDLLQIREDTRRRQYKRYF
jgi:hypothetical protein